MILITSVPTVEITPSAKIVHLPVMMTLQRMEAIKNELSLLPFVGTLTVKTEKQLNCPRNEAVINCKKSKTKKMIIELDATRAQPSQP